MIYTLSERLLIRLCDEFEFCDGLVCLHVRNLCAIYSITNLVFIMDKHIQTLETGVQTNFYH